MKKYLFLAATAFTFAACTNNEAEVPQITENAPQAVAFDTYLSSTTRSGYQGVMNTTQLQTTGFGVFASQTNDAGVYAGTETPDFMYNQMVTYASPGWSYTPLKYWPNETSNDSQDTNGPASSEPRCDVLSFFAYAPYVYADDVTAGTIDFTQSPAIADKDNADPQADIDNVGITGFTANDEAGAPKVSYQIAYSPSKSVDLLWGVAPVGDLDYPTVHPSYGHTTLTGAVKEGMPLLSLLKPSKDQKIKFLFKHALARIGMTVVAAVDQIAPGGQIEVDASDNPLTKIFVNSVTIEDAASPKTIPTEATLNLKNTTANVALWESLVIGDGLKLVINATRELNTDLQGSKSDYDDNPGVLTKETPVIADGKYFMLIPTPGTVATLNVTIDYTVITKDANVDGEYVTTNNVITKKIVLSGKTGTTEGFLNNKAYNLKLILGLTSVKLDAEVADWEVDGSTEVNLPRNNE